MEKVANESFQTKSVSQEPEMRFERKFIAPNIHLEDLVEQLKSSSFFFQEIFYKRKINNIYFDDYNLNAYRQNESGVGEREKYRLRWYGDEFANIKNPHVEIKRKKGEVGTKVRRKLEGVKFNLGQYNSTNIIQLLISSLANYTFLKNKFYQLQPSLYSAYIRRYFLSSCGKFRVTLDFDQVFYNPYFPKYEESKKILPQTGIVIELKYDIKDDVESRLISQEFNWRLSKNSKYVNGINIIHDMY